MELVELFLCFAKIGSLMFGGGLAMLPLLQRELVGRKKWVTEEEILDYYAIGQCTPGIIAVNTATFVGRKRKGVPGGIFATLGVVFPSLVIITIIAAFLANFADLAVVKNAFAAIRVCVCALILNSVIKLGKKTIKDVPAAVIFVLVLAATLLTDLSPVLFVLASALCGIVIKNVRARG
ncbi:MAG: chromate transporter [Firmicutes bacterium]|nr:chromate transporter [Bacillota bacterium]MBQ2041713.1 chromate transporter [Bacillota bacterium]